MSTEHLLGDIGAILHALTDADNEPRKEAEKHLRNLTVQSPGDVLLLLAQIGAQAVGGFQLEQRLLALILLRRLSFTSLPGLFLNDSHHHASEPFEVIAERVRGRIETVLSAGLKDEMDVKMRKGLGTCAAGWASASAARQRPCLSFPPVLLELTSSPHPSHRFTPFQLLDTAPTLLIDSVREPLPISQLASLLLAGMNDPSVDVRVEALKAMRSVILEGVTGQERSEIAPSLIVEAYKSVASIPSSSLKHALDPLVELASVHANTFVQSLPVFLPYLLSLTSPPASPSSSYAYSTYPKSSLTYDEYEPVATSAVEILLCLAELKRNQVLEWEGGRLGSEMIGLLLGSVAAGLQEQPDDARHWMDETDIDDVDDSYPEYAEEAIDRLAVSLGGGVILPALAQHAQALLQQDDWRCRYAALVGIAGVADGCTDLGVAGSERPASASQIRLPAIHGPAVRESTSESSTRLRRAKSDIQESIQTQYPMEVLKVLVDMLQDPVARVRAHAGACIVNFFDCDIPVLTTMLEPLVRAAMSAFRAGPLYAQEQMLSTIASVATHAAADFVAYYRETLDLCLSVLTTPTDASHRKLVGRAMECATMTGLAVGKAVRGQAILLSRADAQTFAVDAVKLAQIMIAIQNNVTAEEDPRTAFLIDAWSCLCRTLGADFKPFLPHVIPPLLKSASYKPPVTEENGSGVEETEVDADVAKVRSGELDEKILAFDNLAVYVYTMRDHFSPYLAQCMELSLDALTFMHSEDVREAAAFLIPALLQVAKESKAWEQSNEPLQQVFQTVINAMAREQSWGYLALLYKSFTDSLHVIALSLPPQLISHLLRTCSSHLDDLRGAREDRLIQEQYMDEGDLDIYSEEQEEEDTALDYMAKALDMCVKYDENVEVRQAVDSLWKRITEVKRMRLRGERLE